MRPLLLIDVDGPLNPYGAPWFRTKEPAPGYRFHVLDTSNGTFKVALNPTHGEHLSNLGDVFDLVWATTWQQEANRLLSPILGLPDDLPVITLHHTFSTHRRCWKTDQVAEWVGSRPFAWIDDEIDRATREWLAQAPWLGPNLPLRIEPHLGLLDDDFEALRTWAETGQ